MLMYVPSLKLEFARAMLMNFSGSRSSWYTMNCCNLGNMRGRVMRASMAMSSVSEASVRTSILKLGNQSLGYFWMLSMACLKLSLMLHSCRDSILSLGTLFQLMLVKKCVRRSFFMMINSCKFGKSP